MRENVSKVSIPNFQNSFFLFILAPSRYPRVWNFTLHTTFRFLLKLKKSFAFELFFLFLSILFFFLLRFFLLFHLLFQIPRTTYLLSDKKVSSLKVETLRALAFVAKARKLAVISHPLSLSLSSLSLDFMLIS